MNRMNIGFLGLGRLGFPCALATESKGHRVMGWDTSEAVRDGIKAGEVPYKEARVHELLKDSKLEFRKVPEMVAMCDIIFVPIQTPHDSAFEGSTRMPFRRVEFDYRALRAGLEELSDEAERQERDITVAVISTVLPGTMDREIKPHLSDRVRLCYNPFFIAQGTTIHDFLHPEFVLLGVDDDDAAAKVRGFYLTISDAQVRRMSIASAECTKCLYNTIITSKIRHANDAARLCHEIKGSNVDDVTRALQSATDRIVSPRYMTAGMEDGGACHPRDNIALSAVCRKHGWSYDPWGAMMNERDGYTEWLAWMCIETGLPIVILGTAFKPETNMETGSPALLLADTISQLGHYCETFDTIINPRLYWDIGAACYFIGCKHKVFAEYRFPAGSVVIDPHRYILEQDGVTVIRIGENGPSYCRR